MAFKHLQFHENILVPVNNDEKSLREARDWLSEAARCGLLILNHEQDGNTEINQEEQGNIFSGRQGFACLNLYRAVLNHADGPQLHLHLAVVERCISTDLPGSLSFEHGRTSPLCHAALGNVLIKLAVIALKDTHPGSLQEQDTVQAERDVSIGVKLLNQAIEYAIEQPILVPFNGHKMGVDEVLYGRAGLLWAMLLLRDLYNGAKDADASRVFSRTGKVLAFLNKSISKVMEIIVLAGWDFAVCDWNRDEDNGRLPSKLSWPWISPYYSLGAMHGDTGVLSVLLSPLLTELSTHCVDVNSTGGEFEAVSRITSDRADFKKAAWTTVIIERSITELCSTCFRNNGYLPMSDPPFPTKTERASPLVQICHGTPGLLLLLACARRNKEFHDKHWQPSWNKAFELGSARVWEQGLLSKGGGICHGMAGNALPWLLWAEVDIDEGRDVNPYLGRALAFLKECMNTKPFAEDVEHKYRMPDHPYGLFEGLAGTIMVWMEALRVVEKKLAKL